MPWHLNLRALSEGGALIVHTPSRLPQHAGPFEYERVPSGIEPARPEARLHCPRCSASVPLARTVCENCGFPFVCDTTPIKPADAPARTKLGWRTVLGVLILLFTLANAVSLTGTNSEYSGHTARVIASLTTHADNRIAINGPASFVNRTELALDLLAKRAPEFYLRMQQNVLNIDYMDKPLLHNSRGERVSLEGIGAISQPESRHVSVLLGTAFPSGIDEFWDYDVFSYAGVLVHELRHIELHHQGSAPGGWEEEVLCEKAAYAALKQAGAPDGVLARYQVYFADPLAGRYQHWYDWYKQW